MSNSLYFALLAFAGALLTETCVIGYTPGVGWLLLTMGGLLAIAVLRRRTERNEFGWAGALLAFPLVFASAIVRYDAHVVGFWGPVLVLLSLGLAAYWNLCGPSQIENLAGLLPSSILAQPGLVLTESFQGAYEAPQLGTDGRQAAMRVLKGLTRALPLVAVFALLLASADPIFAGLIEQMFSWVNGDILQSGWRVAVLTLFLIGWIRVLVFKNPRPDAPNDEDPPGDLLEVSIPLGAVNGLFVSFLVVQAHYLFGGRAHVESWGLTYAEYARRGFFELVAVTGLVFLVAGWAYRKVYRHKEPRTPLALLSGIIVCTFGLALSGLFRMKLYITVYGLSVDRFYAAAGMATICTLLTVLLAAVLRRRTTSWVVSRQVLTALAMLAVVSTMNVDEMIVRTNLGPTTRPESVDVEYLSRLSSDAVPALLQVTREGSPGLASQARLALGRMRPHQTTTWQSWNASRHRTAAESTQMWQEGGLSGGNDAVRR